MKRQLVEIGAFLKPAGAVALALFILVSPDPARAEFIYTATEVGGDVLVAGSGTLDLDGMSYYGSNISTAPLIAPNMGFFAAGGTTVVGIYGDISGPSTLGPGGGVSSLIYSGPLVLVDASNGVLWIAGTYVSDSFLSNSAVYAGQSFPSLGLNPGTYVYSWGSGADADSLTINVVPEPATVGLLVVGAGVLSLRRRRS